MLTAYCFCMTASTDRYLVAMVHFGNRHIHLKIEYTC